MKHVNPVGCQAANANPLHAARLVACDMGARLARVPGRQKDLIRCLTIPPGRHTPILVLHHLVVVADGRHTSSTHRAKLLPPIVGHWENARPVGRPPAAPSYISGARYVVCAIEPTMVGSSTATMERFAPRGVDAVTFARPNTNPSETEAGTGPAACHGGGLFCSHTGKQILLATAVPKCFQKYSSR